MISETIKVFCRPKPHLNELGTSTTSVLQRVDATNCKCAIKGKLYEFAFDSVFESSCSQEEVYNEVAKPIVDSVCRGYSGTVFAYGPTNSGKTYTMRGDMEGANRGVIPRCIEQISATIGSSGDIYVSYLQIYCEIISDLLVPAAATTTPLSIRERDGCVVVDGLSRYKVTSVADIYAILDMGDVNRNTASTNLNQTSSRSHAAVLITIAMDERPSTEAQPVESSSQPQRRVRESSLVLVDLAGSERFSASEGRSYLRHEEARAINLSLSSLGNCISSLSEGRPHVPYRDSKLTRLLQGSLGGGSRTSVLLNVPPEMEQEQEVLSALRFGQRAKRIKVTANVTRFVDYEALYSEAQRCMDAKEDEVRRAHQQSDELRVQMDALADTAEQLRSEVRRLQEAAAVRAVAAASSTNRGSVSDISSGSRDAHVDVASELAAVYRAHETETVTLKERLEKETKTLKTAQLRSSQEYNELQCALLLEQKQHLSTVQELSACHSRLRDLERAIEGRLGEALEQLADKQSLIDDLQNSLQDTAKDYTGLLFEKVSLESELVVTKKRMESMVSRSQLDEMDHLFSKTVSRLNVRLTSLETENAALHSTAVFPPNDTRLPIRDALGASVRMEPGRIRRVSGSSGGSAPGIPKLNDPLAGRDSARSYLK